MYMKKIISMAVMLYITMTVMAQKGELAMNEISAERKMFQETLRRIW